MVAMPILLAILYTNAPLAGLLVYFQFLIYQNVVIAVAAVGMPAYWTLRCCSALTSLPLL